METSIFKIQNKQEFKALSLAVFKHQFKNN